MYRRGHTLIVNPISSRHLTPSCAIRALLHFKAWFTGLLGKCINATKPPSCVYISLIFCVCCCWQGYFRAILAWLDNPDAPQVAISVVACMFGLMAQSLDYLPNP
eukprot:2848834-Amphidinium_carterae.1